MKRDEDIDQMTTIFLTNGFIPVYLLVLFILVTPVYVQGQNQTEIQRDSRMANI
jgi:hypothetical protein